MHELGMCEALLDAVERRAAGRRVQRVRLRVGVLHRVVPASMDQAFEMVAAGTVAEGAEVDLVTIPVQANCGSCGQQSRVEAAAESCPACGAIGVELEGGDELTLESLELVATSADDGSGDPRREVPQE